MGANVRGGCGLGASLESVCSEEIGHHIFFLINQCAVISYNKVKRKKEHRDHNFVSNKEINQSIY